jgi:hypothetical protein
MALVMGGGFHVMGRQICRFVFWDMLAWMFSDGAQKGAGLTRQDSRFPPVGLFLVDLMLYTRMRLEGSGRQESDNAADNQLGRG